VSEIRVPDLGDFDTVDVIEVHVAAGDRIEKDDPLITLETDKATMDVPSPEAGVVVDVTVSAGDKVSKGDAIMTIEAATAEGAEVAAIGAVEEAEVAAPGAVEEAEVSNARGANGQGAEARRGPNGEGAQVQRAATGRNGGTATTKAGDARGSADAAAESSSARGPAQTPATEPRASAAAAKAPGRVASSAGPGRRLVVLGAGPGGYTAAFRAADLGLDVTLIERWPSLGGVCLNVGCIPSKALLHAARVIEETQEMAGHGIDFGAPRIDTGKLRDWKNGVVGQLTRGLTGIAKQRKVRVVHGTGRFVAANRIEVARDGEAETVDFDQCIIAAGSEPVRLPNVPDDPRIMDSTGALELDELPERMLVIGGGIIGLEMATVYAALGVRVSVVELTKTLIPGCDRDLVRPLEKRLASRYEAIMLGTRVVEMTARKGGIAVRFEGDAAPNDVEVYGRVLVAVGRRPNGGAIGADSAGVAVDERGFIKVDNQMRTNVPHIFAIGDIVGPPMLAHKASHEGKVAAEAAAGERSFFDARVIPSVAYTDPEIAWAGLTEDEAKARGVGYDKGAFPWAASGRSLSLGRSEGLTKLLFDSETKRVIGAGIVGPNAGDLISEVALAIEMGCDAEDISLTVHPHPTLSETVAFAAEVAAGTVTDIYVPRR
jgi:dihydrolipoamide dehydrogenase